MLNKDGQRELAYVVQIDDIQPIEGKDRVVSAAVGGWRIMVRKDLYSPGDLAVYFEIDSLVPSDKECFEFMAKYKYKVKTQKFKQFYSQGLLMSAEELGGVTKGDELEIGGRTYKKGDFLTEVLGVKHYEVENQPRKAQSVDKYKKMAQRRPKLFQNPIVRRIYKHKLGKQLLFVFFGKKRTPSTAFPTQFPYVKKTDQERCLIAQTKILTDQGLIPISQIVNKKLPVKVLSMNPDGTTSFKQIIDYQKIDNPSGEVLTLEYGFKPGVSGRLNHLCCTKDHLIYTKRGYMRADELTTNDYVYQPTECYSDEAVAIIYGMLLGDSHIYIDKRSKGLLRVVATNGEAQKEYLEYKKRIFSNVGSICDAGIGNFGKTKHVYHYNLPVDPYIDKCVREDFLVDDKKVVTAKVISRLNEASLAFWYMDDGNLTYRDGVKGSPKIRLNTQGFSKEENDILVDCLINKFGIDCHINEDNKNGKLYYYIYIPVSSTPTFLNIVTPYMCKAMAYKTLPSLEHLLETKNIFQQKIQKVMAVPLLDIRQGQHKSISLPKQFKTVYDITVEDNHNFIADGIVSHNCENMPWVLADKTPFIVTQKCDGSSGTYIVARKKKKKLFDKQKYEFYVCSRNVRQLDENQKSYYDENYYWQAAKKYDIEVKMIAYMDEHPELEYFCWQGEVCSPGIQKNPHGLKELHLFLFHCIDSQKGKWDIRDAVKLWKSLDCETVPIVDENFILPDDFEEFKQQADGFYDASVCEGQTRQKREGFVYYKTTDPNFSFKNVSRSYLARN